MSDKIDTLNKWRMEQFHRNNQPDQSPSTDFVCLTPSSYTDKMDPNVVFVSDSDTEKSRLNPVTSDALIVVTQKAGSSRLGRKRRRADVVCTQLSDSNDSDEDFVIQKRKQKRGKKKMAPILKALPLKPISATRKTAVVVPITKQMQSADTNLQPGFSKTGKPDFDIPSDLPKVDEESVDALHKLPKAKSVDVLLELPRADKHSLDLEEDSPNVDKLYVNAEQRSLKISKQSAAAEQQSPKINKLTVGAGQGSTKTDVRKHAVTPIKHGADLIDELLNSPIPKSNNQSEGKVEQLTNTHTCASDSDLSLFEISLSHDPSPKKHPHNPPPSPVDLRHSEEDCVPYQALQRYSEEDSVQYQVVQPFDNGFSSDSSTNVVSRKRTNKGKQPANKRKKVVAKRSKPLIEQDQPAPTNGPVQTIDKPTAVNGKENMADNSSVVGTANPLTLSLLTNENAALPDGISSSDRQSVSTSRGSKERVNRAIVKPSPVLLVIEDEADDEDDDIVMLTGNEKTQQEMDDMEFARRLQAQFDGENATQASRFPAPERAVTSTPPSVSNPLTRQSMRILEAVGGSAAVGEFLSSPRTSQSGRPAELERVAERLELLEQLAMQQAYLDDETISEILGVPVPPTSGSSGGPRPPLSSVQGAAAGSPRSRRRETRNHGDGNRPNTSAGGSVQRMLQGFLGLEDSVDDSSYEALLELSERIGDVKQAGITPDVIDRLPSREYREGAANKGDNSCHICMSDFESGQQLRTLTCFHEYHCHCIDKWLQRNASCPICRVKVVVE